MNDIPISDEATTLYQFFDALVTDDWTSVNAFGAFAAPLARWLPQPAWRSLWHELGSQHLIAHSFRAGTDCISRWRDRYPINPKTALTALDTQVKLLERYADWTAFCWASWNETLLMCGIQTEALWQLNNAYLILSQEGIVETRNRGTEIRVTQESLSWIFDKVPTLSETMAKRTG